MNKEAVHSACKFTDKSLDAIDESILVNVNCESQNYLLVRCIYIPPLANSKFDRLLTNIFSIASHQPHAVKIIGGDFILPKITWSSTSVLGRIDKLVETPELYALVQQVRKPSRKINILDLLLTINIDSISVHFRHELLRVMKELYWVKVIL